MDKQMEKELTREEIEEMIIDKELFMKIFRLFTHMSKRGKDATVQTLFIELINEMEVQQC